MACIGAPKNVGQATSGAYTGSGWNNHVGEASDLLFIGTSLIEWPPIQRSLDVSP